MFNKSSSGSTSSVAPDSRLYCDGCRHSFSQPPDTVVAVLGRNVQQAA